MELPRALWPWRQSLSIFPPDLAIALGGVVDKLAILVGPLVSPDMAGRDQPDGIDGVGRRGSFERLLTTEWALADEAPLEFLRRVSTGELSFLEIAHQKPTVAKRCIVLFDVGAEQYGGPRLVHLAALILLEQRARTAGAQFSWGILQDPTRELFADVNEESVRMLLAPGSRKFDARDDAFAYYQLLVKNDPEIWFVGGTDLVESVVYHDVFRLQVEDSFDPEKPFDLHLTVFAKRGKPRTARLELPPSNLAVRLLRDPFQVARAKTQKSRLDLGATTNLVFSRDDRKLFLLGAAGELVTIPIPNSPNCNTPPKPRIFRPPPNERIIGVGRLLHTRTIAVATFHGENAFVHELSPRLGSSTHSRRYGWEINSSREIIHHVPQWFRQDDAPIRLGELLQIDKDQSFLLYDGGRMLFKFEEERVYNWDSPVTSVQHAASDVFWLRNGKPPTLMTFRGGIPTGIEMPPNTSDIRCAHGGYFAAQTNSTTWHLLDPKGTIVETRELPPEYEVLGVSNAKSTAYYALDRKRTTIYCFTSNQVETCCTLSSPIKSVKTTVGCWYIAFLTEDDELCIYSREFKTFVLRMRLGVS